MEITTDTTNRITPPVLDPTTTGTTSADKNILTGNALKIGEGVPKTDGSGNTSIPDIPKSATVSAFSVSDDQANLFATLVLKLLQMAAAVLEIQAQNLKNRQTANESVYSAQLQAADATRTKNRTNAWVGLAAGGVTLVGAGFAFKQTISAGAKTVELSKMTKPQTGEGVNAVSADSKLQIKGLGREIDQLNTKAQTFTAGLNAVSSTANSGAQIASANQEFEAAAKDALANLISKGAQSLDQGVTSNQAVFDKFASELVSTMKSVMTAAVR
jgi:hypothetical protein